MMEKLIEEQQRLQRFVRWMESRERKLGHEGLDLLRKARNDLWDVERQITEKEYGA